MFWERFFEACKMKGVSPTPTVKELNIASGLVTKWKNGSIPNGETLIRIADYLNCSVDYLLGRTDNQNSSPAKAEELSNDEIELIQNYRNLNDEGREKVRDYVTDIVLSGRYKKDNEAGMVQEA